MRCIFHRPQAGWGAGKTVVCPLSPRCLLVALGLDGQGNKHILGLREGSTENACVARALLADLLARGLSSERPLLFVIDGGKALRKAIREVFGDLALVQRCQQHKRRNILDHLPKT
ncbi:MAG TPA: hypothetical protein ENG84_07705, partial [Gammaproteobacteria bacterium]|nr:hypothetical protein [Gammaproteobacteria bacterium]